MRRLALAAVCLSLISFAARADPDYPAYAPEVRTARNTLYFELLGAGVIYSINYERFFNNDLNGRVGMMYLSANSSDNSGSSASAGLLIVPLTVSYMGFRKGPHGFELGAGIDIAYASASASSGGSTSFDSGSNILGTAIMGYRYAPLDGGFNFRAAFTPLFGKGGFLPWFGIAVGVGI